MWADTEARLRSDLAGSQGVVNNLRAQAMRDQDLTLTTRQELDARMGKLALLQVDLEGTQAQVNSLILRAGGSRFSTASPESWPHQARLAANRDWKRLDVLKAQLVGGVRRLSGAEAGEAAATRSQFVPKPEDDLTVVEGIGPKIDEILKQNGIRTYSQLARTDVSQLETILDKAGVSFCMADPASRPEQASWAATTSCRPVYSTQPAP